MKHSFGSDNHSGVHPLIMEAIVKENNNFKTAYGDDPYTIDVLGKLESILGGNCKALFVVNGTGANVVALAAFVNSFHSILAPKTAHINVDECGAPEKFTGSKIIPLPSPDGKVTSEVVMGALTNFGEQHHSQPRILSISQPTELGTLYTPDEIKALADLMHSHNGYLHIDGSRISNAAASLGLPVKSFTADCGADVLSFGGTKNGLLMGEAVVIFNTNSNALQADILKYIRKQATQLYSKNRFIAAQFDAYLSDNLYIRLASHSNAMAKYLAELLKDIPEIQISKKVESNAVFAIIPKWLTEELQKKYYFYVWDEVTGEVRWMCSFNTQKENIEEFVADIKDLLSTKE
ncbi:MAG: aminotransferase class I/II-fold pyridoxal phosphate-dependent enzyme [Bacteroidales bacterium]|nr:aminotransferase class I/II-fold pyridoxal phosphate-dependent enzyme [Bacteroidales bacterium]